MPGPKRQRFFPPAQAVRGEHALSRMAAASRAVKQIRGALRDRRGRKRKPARYVLPRPRPAPIKPQGFNAQAIKKLEHDVWITACSERNILVQFVHESEFVDCLCL